MTQDCSWGLPEQDYYIPPDVCVNTDGSIPVAEWQKVMNLHDRYRRYTMTVIGQGMPEIQYLTQQGAFQHGETILDYRFQPRIIQYVLQDRHALSRKQYWQQRARWLNWLRPNRQLGGSFAPGRLRKVLPDGSIRDIDAFIEEGPLFEARTLDAWDELAIAETLRFRCPDPTWYDPVTASATWTVEMWDGWIFHAAGYTGHLVFPVNSLFGTDVLSGTTTITYTGTWYAYPTIIILGPISNLVLKHVELDRKLALAYDIGVGEMVTITTAYGNKTITNQLGENLIGTLSTDSDLNFFLAPDPLVAGGVNTLTVSGNNADVSQTLVTMHYNTRYIGI